MLYFHGQGVPVDYAEARRYFEMAALTDHDSAYNLATIYQASTQGMLIVRGTLLAWKGPAHEGPRRCI